jgi:DNA invertase Pin-like site-specific DNA recombinase
LNQRNTVTKKLIPALGYLRTSSATNVGTDKDSEGRQRKAIEAFAKKAGFEIIASFYDAAVSGKDPIATRQGFGALLEKLASNGVRTVIIEDASRFARDLITQETGIAALQTLGVTVLASNGDDLTASDDEMRIAMRQIAGVFSQLEKSRLVGKLRAARKSKKERDGKCEGRKTIHETNPQAVAIARSYRVKRKGKPMSLRKIAEELAQQGHLNERGKPFNPKSVSAMLK